MLRAEIGDRENASAGRITRRSEREWLGGRRHQRPKLARFDVDFEQSAGRDGDVIIEKRAFSVRGEVGKAPAAAPPFHHQPVGRGVARVHDVEVGVEAGAPRRRIADALAVRGPADAEVAPVFAGQAHHPAIVDAEDLVLLVALPVGERQRDIARNRRELSCDHRLLAKGKLSRRGAGHGDLVQLAAVVEPRADQHRSPHGVPAEQPRRAVFEIGLGLFHQRRRYGGNAAHRERRRRFDCGGVGIMREKACGKRGKTC